MQRELIKELLREKLMREQQSKTLNDKLKQRTGQQTNLKDLETLMAIEALDHSIKAVKKQVQEDTEEINQGLGDLLGKLD